MDPGATGKAGQGTTRVGLNSLCRIDAPAPYIRQRRRRCALGNETENMNIAVLYTSILALAALGFHSATGQEAAIKAESGSVSGPFVLANGYIWQPVDTAATNGGRAVYTFTITNAGIYVIQAFVNAPNSAANSLYLNIDAEPADWSMIWDIPLTSGFEPRIVSWRGNGTADNNQFVPKIFNLTQGAHQLILMGREANAQWKGFSVVPVPAAPQNLRILSAQ